MDETGRSAQLVRFWHAIEMFSPQDVPKLAKQRGGPVVVDVGAAEPMPWEPEHPLAQTHPLPPGKTWRFTVYAGLYQIEKMRNELLRVFGPDSVPPDARPIGTTAMFALTVDEHGTLLADSPTLSAAVWAVGRLRSPGPNDRHWLDGFDEEEKAFSLGLNQLCAPEFAEAVSRFATAAKSAADRTKRSGREAAAKGLGTAATAATAAAVTALGGPVAGSIAGAAVGTFVEKMVAKSAAAKESGKSSAEPATFAFSAEDLHQFSEQLADAMGVAHALDVGGVRVKCVQVSPNWSTDVEQDFLNSQIAEDLARLAEAVEKNDIGPALRSYLADGYDTGSRVDVRHNPGAVITGLMPNRIPGGRWPGDPHRPLVLSQQFAVNQLMDELADSAGIFAVNGPPGTGKTTMLRDVLAAIVVQHAHRLAGYDDPRAAFSQRVGAVRHRQYRFTINAPSADITGFEIVVATASNDAAANVTAEIPAIAAVSGARQEALAANYFPDLASYILDRPAWGLVAAVLGNMKNRSNFAKRFWWGKDSPSGDQSDPDQSSEPPDDRIDGMQRILALAADDPGSPTAWRQAVTAFQSTESEVRQLTAERQSVADDIGALHRLSAGIEAMAGKIETARQTYKHRAADLVLAQDNKARTEASLDAARTAIAEHRLDKPNFWISLSTWFRAGREWHSEHRDLTAKRKAAEDAVQECVTAVGAATADCEQIIADERELVEKHDSAVAEYRAISTRVERATEQWPGTIPFGDIVADERRFQLCNAWADEAYVAARHRLFLSSLELHRAFAAAAASRIRGNLAVMALMLRNELEAKPDTAVLTAAWQTLFLIVPMVSTTFASLPRLFAGLEREALGWLLIDEAGQATPQQAASGLWRTRRAVIVGDPQQLEPIVTLPLPAQTALLAHYGVAEQWTPDHTSAQRVADRLAHHGTNLPEPEGQTHVWVGAPLRVHRRCDRPMFAVANTIAYGGDLMVYGTPARGEFPGENTWFDIRAPRGDGNWIPAEGVKLRELLDYLVNGMGIPASDIRIVSPFRAVVHGAKEIAANAIDRTFADNNVGTVHTVQGQESDVVILVLGTPPQNGGARRWASEKPNLLNVAVSRAKRRFYVIGNHQLWSEQRYFDVLAAIVPRDANGS
ncbi:AAA domain-containing protein [Nocardia sp. NPDC088792]|uniref:DEAD/DEAH box helicase n=1 Tax=Nocardia sp. NPDC088792 TaxID=3364332 RepID=UPI00381694AC